MKRLHWITLLVLFLVLLSSACAGWSLMAYQALRLRDERLAHTTDVETEKAKARMLDRAFRDCLARAATKTQALEQASDAMACMTDYKRGERR